tara:strand:+ start:79129 stop:79395 length:267 start_codon:yes stop_codon:yes gene_type:complete
MLKFLFTKEFNWFDLLYMIIISTMLMPQSLWWWFLLIPFVFISCLAERMIRDISVDLTEGDTLGSMAPKHRTASPLIRPMTKEVKGGN